ncbi:hypothetical protein KGM_203869 [Danaus plexippus plexippus]|uniref:Uncharacterized protein n=1 Tax=Danaus plexippus plexippus TaxID=278856 RepID=A0A212EQ10_DANPL|nr:hypothetical protein KGM_203869 [Danaus plexippus plexippus]
MKYVFRFWISMVDCVKKYILSSSLKAEFTDAESRDKPFIGQFTDIEQNDKKFISKFTDNESNEEKV